MSINKAVNAWSEWLGETLSPALRDTYEKRLKAFAKRRKRKDVTWKTINQFLRDKGKRGLKYSTIKQYISALKSFCKFAYAEGLLDKDPSSLIKIRPQTLAIRQLEDEPRVPFTYDEYESILAYVTMW